MIGLGLRAVYGWELWITPGDVGLESCEGSQDASSNQHRNQSRATSMLTWRVSSTELERLFAAFLVTFPPEGHELLEDTTCSASTGSSISTSFKDGNVQIPRTGAWVGGDCLRTGHASHQTSRRIESR